MSETQQLEGIEDDNWFTSNIQLANLTERMIHHIARMQYHHKQYVILGDTYREALDEIAKQNLGIVHQTEEKEKESNG